MCVELTQTSIGHERISACDSNEFLLIKLWSHLMFNFLCALKMEKKKLHCVFTSSDQGPSFCCVCVCAFLGVGKNVGVCWCTENKKIVKIYFYCVC